MNSSKTSTSISPAQAEKTSKRGSVLVVGGGIAGMQAALDCADSGFKVYLLEKQPAIGGNMARLDKTFPTNDCAMCMISPKLVETGRHLNIEIISCAELETLEGSAGDFTATIKKHARYVDEEKCNGCGDCEEACPVTLKDPFNGDLSGRKAIFRLYPQAIPNVYTIDKSAHPAPCRATCPAGVNAQGYIALIGKGKFLEALDVVRERMPFAGICGRICHHPCESECNRGSVDEPLAVRNLKRFLADYERDRLRQGQSIQREPSEIPAPEKKSYREKVAVIGAGPAGLTCADTLAQQGYDVTVLEKENKPGGMLRYGIPAYRLARDFLDHEIELVLEENIHLETGRAWGRDFSLAQLREQGYNAVFTASGAPLARELKLEGCDLLGLRYGLPFLRDVNTGGTPALGRRVAVIGGGNVAMDVARCARRMPGVSSVNLYCLESRDEMPAHHWEIAEAEEEGVIIHPSWGPRRLTGTGGKLKGLELVRCTSVFDENKKFNPTFEKKRRTAAPADTVILAIGQQLDREVIQGELELDKGWIAADSLTLETSVKGVFAGGDAVLGPATLVEAVAQGHRAAESIHRFLRGMDLREGRPEPATVQEYAEIPVHADRTHQPRLQMPVSAPGERTGSFMEIEKGFDRETAVKEAERCLQCGICSQCLECARVCKAGAVDHWMEESHRRLKVGAVIMAGGYDLYDAAEKAEYGLGRYANVVTSLQFERILSASGPFNGKLKRLSDGKTPKKIAWIQCVGSRDVTAKPYCSGICCMYATKEAIVAIEHEAEVEATIFYIDMRTFGKGYEGFLARAKNKYGVRFVRGMVSSIKENPYNQDLLLVYTDNENGGGITGEAFDMVVLSPAVTARPENSGTAAALGIEQGKYGFFQGTEFAPLLASREGVFLCGAAAGPVDIPETVMQSSAAAALCGQLLKDARHTDVQVKEYPVEKTVDDQPARIGVFVCHCGINIASVIKVEKLTEYIQTLPDVAHAEHFIYTCSQDSQEAIKKIIEEKELNRVIVASCTPRTHEGLFQETLREAGLNKYLFEMADIREQCSWVHQSEPDRATEKAQSLVTGSVGKAAFLEPLLLKQVEVIKAALVIGGGLAGMTAALSLADQGFKVFLVERSDYLGGNIDYIGRCMSGCDWREHRDDLIYRTQSHPAVKVLLETRIEEVSGFVGRFTSRLTGHRKSEIRHGVVIVATGAKEYTPPGYEFLYAKSDKVITQQQLERQLAGHFIPKTVVMIQCVGSRNQQNPYCSRVCCGAAIKNALAVKEANPDARVYVLYRDITTYGMKELYYREAREKGVMFVHFPDHEYPAVTSFEENGTECLRVSVTDTVLQEPLEIETELVVLSTGIVPEIENNRLLAKQMKLSLDAQGFFMEAHVKLQPVDFANAGFFVCGLAHSPKYAEENVTQALAAAGRAATILSQDRLEVGGVVSIVDEEKCAACLTCVRECVFNAPFINAEGKAEIEAAKCRGCGNCAAACPGKAIQLMTFTDAQQHALFKGILNPNEHK